MKEKKKERSYSHITDGGELRGRQQWSAAEKFKATAPREDRKVQEPVRARKRCAQGLEHDLYREGKGGRRVEERPAAKEMAISGHGAVGGFDSNSRAP
jgi:hypothetical protein